MSKPEQLDKCKSIYRQLIDATGFSQQPSERFGLIFRTWECDQYLDFDMERRYIILGLELSCRSGALKTHDPSKPFTDVEEASINTIIEPIDKSICKRVKQWLAELD